MAKQNATVLVVDDNPVNREYLSTILINAHYDPIEASNGLEAIHTAKKTRPTLIISDILMPVMDGYEMVQKLKSDPLLQDIKVIFYTAQYQEEAAKDLAKQIGVTHFLQKPASKQKILKAINAVLQEENRTKISKQKLKSINHQHMSLMQNKLYKKVHDLEKLHQELEEKINERTQKLKELNIQLKDETTRDPLTGLYNRRYLDDTIIRELSHSKRKKNKFMVAMVDIDHFKAINDKYGHRAGDIVLYKVAQFLQRSVRSEDMVCRYGGDEILMIVYDINPEGFMQRLEKLHKTIPSFEFKIDRKIIREVTLSIGISVYPKDSPYINALIDAADQASYQAKKYRNKIVQYNDIKNEQDKENAKSKKRYSYKKGAGELPSD